MLALHTLGGLRLIGPHGDVLPGRRKELVLLTYVARRAPSTVRREELAALLWGERPEARARQSLRQALLHLKRAVGEAVTYKDETVVPNPHHLTLDATEFEAALKQGRVEHALSLWRGPFLVGGEDLGGEAFRLWLETERSALHVALTRGIERCLGEAEQCADWRGAAHWADHLARVLPFDESAHRRLIDALRLDGRPDDASTVHAAFVTRARRDLHEDPSPAFLHLADGLESGSRPRERTAMSLGSAVLFTPDLVGREGALARVHAAWDRVLRTGREETVLVEGEEGIGKTRLCEEFLRVVAARAGAALILRSAGAAGGDDGDEGTPRGTKHSGTTIRALLAGLSDAPGVLAVPPEALSTLAAFAPPFAARTPAAASPARGWPIEKAVGRVVSEVAAELPVIVFVDDVGAVDPVSRDCLTAVAAEAQTARVLLLMTARTDEPGSSEVTELVPHRAGVTRLRLPPLDPGMVERLVESMLEIRSEERHRLASRLAAESGGNPFLCIQLVAALLDEGRLLCDADGLWRFPTDASDTAFPLPRPSGVREAIRRRLDRLDLPVRSVAEAAAVADGPVDTITLRRMTRLGELELESALEELLARRMLRIAATAESYEFVHGVSRRVTYHLIPPRRRRRWHRRAIEAIQAGRATHPDARTMLVHHRGRAGAWPLRFVTSSRARRRVMTATLLAVGVAVAAFVRADDRVDFHARDWLVVADLENATGDRDFDRALVTAFNAATSQSRHLNVLPPARVAESLRRMHRSERDGVSETVAREVAIRENVRAVATLGIDRIDTVYVLTARVVDPGTGVPLKSFTARAEGKADVLPALDRLALLFRRGLGESLRHIEERGKPLPQVTTASLPALKRWADGSAAWSAGRWQEARTLWGEAIALDSNFALAHAALGNLHDWANDRTAADYHYARAVRLVDRLPERERLWVQSRIAGGRGDVDEAIRLLQRFVTVYPDDRDAWYNLGSHLKEAGRCAEAIPTLAAASAVDPNMASALINVAVCNDLLGKHRVALATFDSAFVRDPSSRTAGAGYDINRIYGFAALKAGDSAAARRTFEEMLGGDATRAANGYRSLAYLEMAFGRYRAAVAFLKEAIVLNQVTGAKTSEFRNRLILARAHEARDEAREARRELEVAARLADEIDLPPIWLAFLAQHQARHGDIAAATRNRTRIADAVRPENAKDRAALLRVTGEMAVAAGDFETAIETLTLAYRLDRENHVLEPLARAYRLAGYLDRAIDAYTTLLRDRSLGWEAQEAWFTAHYELGRLYEARRDVSGALRSYRRLLEMWRDGDTELSTLADVKGRVKRLEGRGDW